MEGMKKKKSSELDGISQDLLLIGADKIAVPLKRMINNSIESEVFPKEWKRAVVTPILKKGDQKDKTDYRPVSCLAAASKVSEKLYVNRLQSIWNQTNYYLRASMVSEEKGQL